MRKIFLLPYSLILACTLLSPLDAATYTVTVTADSGAGSLRTALSSVSAAGGDTIQFALSSGSTIQLASSLPIVNLAAAPNTLTIDGASSNITIDGTSSSQIFFINTGTVTFQNFSALTLENGKSQGAVGGTSNTSLVTGAQKAGGGGGGLGAGGAIFVGANASVVMATSVASLSLTGNQAVGGAGAEGGGFAAFPTFGSGAGPGGGGGGGMLAAGGVGGAFFNSAGVRFAAGGGGGGGGSTIGSNGSDGTGILLCPMTPTPCYTGGTGGNGGGAAGGAGGAGGQSPSPLTMSAGTAGGTSVTSFSGGGGGGGAAGEEANGGMGGSGGDFAGGGGGGGNTIATSTPGATGGTGGFGGGGGGAGTCDLGSGIGGAGGLGGGGGGGGGSGGGAAGFGGGAGEDQDGTNNPPTVGGGGGGGAGLGGAVFIRQGGNLTLATIQPLSGNFATGGAGGTTTSGLGNGANGSGLGTDLFLMSGGTLTLNISGSATISSIITSNNGSTGSAGGLVKEGAGTLTLTGTNNSTSTPIGYTGTTTISAGTLSILDGINLGIIDGFGSGGVTLQNSSTLQVTQCPATVNNPMTLASGGGTIALPATCGSGSSVAYNGAIGGTGNLIVQGPGALAFGGTNTYNGSTTITASGTLSTSFANLGTSTGLVFNPGTLNLTATGSYASAVTLTGSGTFAVNSSVTGTISSVISGGGSLTKTGAGTLIFTNTNTYTGGTFINAGTLALSLGGSLSATAPVTISGGIFDISGITPASTTIGDLSGTAGTINLGTKTLVAGTANGTTYAGVIGGTGALTKQGAGTLTLSGASTYQGGTTISAGTIRISSDPNLGDAAGAVTFGVGGTGVLQTTSSLSMSRDLIFTGAGALNVASLTQLLYSGTISGAGAFTKQGAGLMSISSANPGYTGSVTIAGGALIVNGSLPAPILVNANTLLGGSGTVGSVTNNGIVSPGNSIDTLNIMGNYTQTSSGTLFIEIDSTNQSDLLNISGTASLDGTLDVLALAGTYFSGSNQYVILNAAGGRSGTFPTVNIIDPHGKLKLFVNYFPTQVVLSLTSNSFFTAVPRIKQHNPRQVANYLESLSYFSGGAVIPAQQNLYGVVLDLEALASSNRKELLNALNQLHPSLFGAFEIVNTTLQAYVSQMINRHPADLCCLHTLNVCTCHNIGLWAEPFGLFLDQKRVDKQKGFDATAAGIIGGADYCLGHNLLIGLGVGYSATWLKWHERAGNADIDSLFASLYADWAGERGHLGASFTAGTDDYAVKRRIHFPGVHRTAKNHHDGYNWDAHVGAGLDFEWSQIYLSPFLSFDYTLLHQYRYKETGAQSLNLHVRAKNSRMIRLEEGVYLTRSFSKKHACWTPGIWLGCVTEWHTSSRNYTASFVHQPGHFSVWSYHTVSNRLSTGADVTCAIGNHFSTSLRYGLEVGRQLMDQTLDARLEFRF